MVPNDSQHVSLLPNHTPKAMDICSKADPRQSFGVILQLLRLLEMDYAQVSRHAKVST